MKKIERWMKVLAAAVVVGAVSGGVTAKIIVGRQELTEAERIKEFYLTENAVHVSPHHIRKAMDEGNKSFVLVDLRSEEEYKREHIVGAVNIPAYKDPETSAYGDVERIVGEFAKLPEDKEIIVYCYSMPCMTGRKVGKMLAEREIYVKHLGVGWNEWRYYWELWNHEHEWSQVRVKDYIVSGEEPGEPVVKGESKACPVDNALGC